MILKSTNEVPKGKEILFFRLGFIFSRGKRKPLVELHSIQL